MVNLLIVEDNDIVRNTMSELMDMEDRFSVRGIASDGIEALKLLEKGLDVDIILADLNMPEMDGIALTEAVRAQYPDMKVIILTMHDKPTFAERAMAAGAKGYWLKDGNLEALFDHIVLVKEGITVLDSNVSK